MPCHHKFLAELHLEHLVYEAEILILGTSNPALPKVNSDEWFYRRPHNAQGHHSNNFLEVLLRLYKEPNLIKAKADDWKQFCQINKTANSDLIFSLKDGDAGNGEHEKRVKTISDAAIATHFKKHRLVDINQILRSRPSIRYVYLTKRADVKNHKFWYKLWSPVCDFTARNDIRVQPLLPHTVTLFSSSLHTIKHTCNQMSKPYRSISCTDGKRLAH